MNGRKIAILIGINNYERCGQLNFAVQDVEALRDILLDLNRGGYQEEYVKLLMDNDGLSPHRANVLRMIRQMARAADPQDDILFYFSGHGLTHEGQAYLVPKEGSADDAPDSCVSISGIRNQLEQSKASSKLMILDACHSGLEMGKPASGRMTAEFEAALKNVSETAGIAILSSCKANERSLEDSELAHGVFSYYLTQGLTRPADSDGDLDISIFEAFEYVSKNVKEWTIKHDEPQTPTLFAKLAREIVLVTVPKPVLSGGKSGLAVVKRLLLHKVLTGEYYKSPSQYRRAKESTNELCVAEIGRLGATMAELFRPEDIASVDELNRTYTYGTFGARLVDERDRFDCVLDVEAESDALKNEELFVELVKKQDFDILEYQLTAPINLVKLYKLSSKYNLKVTSYDPPRRLIAKTTQDPFYSLTVENTTTRATIRVYIVSQVTDAMLKEIGLPRIQEIAQASQ